MGGTLDALDDDKCQWMIRVEDGFAVEISVITFDVDCSNKLEMYEGSDSTGGEIGKFCNDNTPGLLTSQTSSVYINWNNPGSNKFKATWKQVRRLHDHVDPRWGDQRPSDLQGGQREQVDGGEDCQHRLHPQLGRVTQSVWISWQLKWSHVRTK